MKKLIIALALCVSAVSSFSQYITKDTVIGERNVRMTYQPGRTDSVELYVFCVGLGEALRKGESLSSGLSRIGANGPHAAFAAGFSPIIKIDSLPLNIVYATLQPGDWNWEYGVSRMLRPLLQRFKVRSLHMSGLSMGPSQLSYSLRDTSIAKLVNTFVSFKGNWDIPGIQTLANYKKAKLISWESSADNGRGGNRVLDTMNKYNPGSGIRIINDACGATHCCWPCFFGGKVPLQWNFGGQTTENIYQYAMRHRGEVNVTPPPPPPPALDSLLAEKEFTMQCTIGDSVLLAENKFIIQAVKRASGSVEIILKK